MWVEQDSQFFLVEASTKKGKLHKRLSQVLSERTKVEQSKLTLTTNLQKAFNIVRGVLFLNKKMFSVLTLKTP